jgi:hypothetical protein
MEPVPAWYPEGFGFSVPGKSTMFEPSSDMG